jgi:uncharacterized protein (TIGR03643 family)
MANRKKSWIDPADVSRIIEMAWEDRTPFDAILQTYGLNESKVIDLMRQEMQPSSFRMWRKRVTGRGTKHAALRSNQVKRAYCPTQYKPK